MIFCQIGPHMLYRSHTTLWTWWIQIQSSSKCFHDCNLSEWVGHSAQPVGYHTHFFLWVLSANVCKTRFKNGWLADWADYNSSLAWRRWDITLSNNIKPHSTTLRILKIYIDLSWSIWPVLICFGKLLNTTSGSMEVMVTSCDITSRNVLTCSALPSVARDLTHGLWTTLSDYHLG